MPPVTDISTQYQIISESYGIPLFLLDEHEKLVDAYSLFSQSSELLFNFSDFKNRFLAMWKQDKIPKIVSSELNQVWAGIPFTNEKGLQQIIVIGPVFLSDVSKNMIVEYAYSYDITERGRERLLVALNLTHVCSYIEFARLAGIIAGITYGEYFDPFTLSLVRLSDLELMPFNELSWEERNTAQKGEGDSFNSSFLFENNLLDCIRNGNLGKLKRLLMTSNYAKFPQFTDTHLRIHKNNFIGLLFLVTRMASEGGLNWSLAYTLNEQYIQQVESLRDIESVFELSREMLYDYTARVGSLKLNDQYSRRVNDCCNFIHEHIDENLRVSDIAVFSGFSSNYISRIFKEETGQTINEYIRQVKVEEAKTLLKYSSLSLAEISQQLSFSSQSFFTSTFHRMTGMTPLQYRGMSDL